MKRVIYKSLIFIILISACLLCFSCADNTSTEQAQEPPHTVEHSVQYSTTTGGKIQGNDWQIVEDGQDGEEVTAVPLDGYVFIRWSDGNTNATRKETNVRNDLYLHARFVEVFSVEYTADENGYLEGDESQSIVYGNDSTAITAIPNEGYFFNKWSDGKKDNPRQDKNVTKSLQIKAIFSKIYVTVEYLETNGGHVSSWIRQSVGYGEDTVPVTAVPHTGYKFVGWSDGVTDATRIDSNITSDIIVTAIFKKKNYTVNYVAGTGGHIVGETTQSVPYLERSSSVTAVADEGYKFVRWENEYNVSTPSTRTDTIFRDVTYTAIFEKLVNRVYYLAGSGGNLVGEQYQDITYGENSTPITAIANEDYEFIEWSDGVTDATRIDRNITSNIIATAIFKKIKFTINYVAGTGGHIVGETTQSVPYLERSSSVTAVADEGYEFIEWSDGVTDATRFENNVTKNITVSAIFDIKVTFAGGIGTLNNPYLIETYEQLLNMKSRPNAAYKLISDLDLSGIDHEPIFDQNLQCHAFLDGDDHTISNLTIDTVHPFPSLFGVIGSYGKIANLNIVNASITINDLDIDSAMQRVGILCGISFGELENIAVDGTIQGEELEKDNIAIGGLSGQTWDRVTDCHSNVTIALNDIDANYIYAGGLVGVASNSFFNCSSTNSITIISLDDSKKEIRDAAGLASYFTFNEPTDIFVENCHSETEIYINAVGYKESGVCGGLINQISSNADVTVSNCSAKGSLSATAAGGLVKLISCDVLTITDSYFDGEINCYNAAGFVYQIYVSKEENTIIENCYSKGTINTSRVGCGFFYMVLTYDVTISKCYSGMDISSGEAYGFGYTFAGTAIQQCFTYGELIARNRAAGLVHTVGRTTISDCYSCCNIMIRNSETKLYVGGLIEMVAVSNVINCYFAGTILCQGNDDSVISALCQNLSSNAVVENCHWLNVQTEGYNEVVAFSIYREDTVFINIYSYDSLEDMKHPNSDESLADILNGDSSDPVWIQYENNLPTLKFAVN